MTRFNLDIVLVFIVEVGQGFGDFNETWAECDRLPSCN